MNSLVTPDGIQRIRQSLPGPIIVRVAFPQEFQKQNQRLQAKNSSKLFLQLKDNEAKATAYIFDETYDKLHEKLADNDLLEIFSYEVQEIKPGQKIVKIIWADLVRGENEVDETSNSMNELSINDRMLLPTRESKEGPKTGHNKRYPQVDRNAPFGRSFQSYINGLDRDTGAENQRSEYVGDRHPDFSTDQDQEKISPFGKSSPDNKRKVNMVSKSLFTSNSKVAGSTYQDWKKSRVSTTIQNANRFRGDDDTIYTPISQLGLWDQNWMIKARVYHKGNKVTFQRKDNSENSLFNINFIDKDGSEISATFFENAIVEKYYDEFETGKIYGISGGTVKANTRKYGKSQNDLQIVFDAKSPIWFSELEEDPRIPRGLYNFVKIQDVYTKEAGSTFDIVGIVASVGSVETLNMNDGRNVPIRRLEIMDDTLKPIEVTLWDYKTALKIEPYSMVMISPVRMREYAGVKSLSVPNQSEMIFNNNLPDVPIIKELREWFGNADKRQIKSSIKVAILEEHARTISELEEGTLEEGTIYWTKAYVSYIFDEKVAFAACPQCKKQVDFDKEQYFQLSQMSQPIPNTQDYSTVQNSEGGNVYCPKCNRSFQSPLKRSLIRVKLADATGSLTATAFGSTAEKLVNKNTDVLFDSQIMNNKAELEDHIYQEYKIQLKYIGNYNDQKKFVIQKVLSLDYPGESQDILSRLEVYKSVAPKLICGLYDIF